MTTTTLQTNANEDLFLVDGRNLVILSDIVAAEQSIRQATKLRLTENQLNQNEGVDYFGTIFSPQPDIDAARVSLSAAILSSPDVVSIESLTINITNNMLQYEARVMTVHGQVNVSSENDTPIIIERNFP